MQELRDRILAKLAAKYQVGIQSAKMRCAAEGIDNFIDALKTDKLL